MWGPYFSSIPGYKQTGLPLAPAYNIRSYSTQVNRSAVLAGGVSVGLNDGRYQFPTVAAPLSLVSSSTEDSASGTGCRTVLVYGYTSDLNIVSETIALTGTTPALSATPYIRIFLMLGVTAGASGTNVGAITGTIGGQTATRIEVGVGQSEFGVFTIPMSWAHGGVITRVGGTIPTRTAEYAVIRLKSRAPGEMWRDRRIGAAYNTPRGSDSSDAPLFLGPGTDIDLVITDISTTNTPLIASYDVIKLA